MSITQHNEKLIEAVSRAMVAAIGKNPDEKINYEDGYATFGPRWRAARNEAIKQIAAFETIREFWQMTGKQF